MQQRKTPGEDQIDKVRNIPYTLGMSISDRSSNMPSIHEQATLTSKGQITLPKAIRQALGVVTGGKVAFELRGGEVIVTRADAEHEDPAIGAFLGLLEEDIRKGRNVGKLPDELTQAMLANLAHSSDLEEDIEGEVAL
jgi:antitoxin PrlF